MNGVAQMPIQGVSMLYSFNDPKAAERHETQYFEMFGNRGIYHKGWTAVTRHKTPWLLIGEKTPPFDDDVWELYDTSKDWSQANNLAKQMPEKLHELQRLWLIEATRYNVLPLDDDLAKRLNADTAGRPVLIKGTRQILFGGMEQLSENSVINIKNKSHSVTAEITVPADGGEGVIIAQGGNIGGWSLYAKGGKLKYCYNLLGVQYFYVEASEHAACRRSSGADGVRLRRRRPRQGRTATLYVDGKKVGTGQDRRHGRDGLLRRRRLRCWPRFRARLSRRTTAPRGNAFTGRVKGVEIAIADAAENVDHLVSPEEAVRIALARQ